MDDPNITMEEYIRVEEEKAQKRRKVFNWEIAKYGKIWYDEDIHDLRFVETKFPAKAFNDGFSSKIISTNNLKTDSENDNEKVNMPSLPPPEPTVSCFDDLDFFKDFENEFPAIVYNDAPTSKSDLLTEQILSPQRIDLNDETSLSEFDEEEQNVLYFNDLFPFNMIYPDDLKSDMNNGNDEIDIGQPSRDMSVIQLPNVINVNAQRSNKLLETSSLEDIPRSTLKKTIAFADEGSSYFDTDKIMARMDGMTLKMDAQYKELQSNAKKPNLDEDDIPCLVKKRQNSCKLFQSTNAFVKETFMDLKTQLETVAKNHQASIQNLETKFDRLADKQSGRPSGSLPSKTQPNLKGHNSKAYQPPQSRNEHVNAVFTRSGKSYSPPVNPNDQQDNSETPVNFDSDDEDEPTPQPKTQNPKPAKETLLPKPYKPKIFIDVIDEILEEYFDALLDEGSKILHSIKGTLLKEEIFAEFYEFMAMTADKNSDYESDTKGPPFKKITINTNYKIKMPLEEPPTDLELKPLLGNLEYLFLEEPFFILVIISS
ncbi:hypothetical protein Tco_1346868 [Tanacetum coccineum]